MGNKLVFPPLTWLSSGLLCGTGFCFFVFFFTFPLAPPPRTEHAVGNCVMLWLRGGKWSITDEGESYNRKTYSYRLPPSRAMLLFPARWTRLTANKTAQSHKLLHLHWISSITQTTLPSPPHDRLLSKQVFGFDIEPTVERHDATPPCVFPPPHPKKKIKPLGSLELFLELFTRQWLT